MRNMAEEICRQFGKRPEDVLDKATLKAFADMEDEQPMEDMLAELPPLEEPVIVEEEVAVVADDLDGLIQKLADMIANEETAKEDVTKAEELKARLEELKAAKANAQEFVDSKAAPAVEEEVIKEPAV